MNPLVVHPLTKRQLDLVIAKPGHAILLAGASGIGKTTLAESLAANILKVDVDGLTGHAYVRQLSPVEGKSLGIEEVRSLEHFLSLRVPGGAATNRIVIIYDADALTGEAQNALLKTLEEPPAGTLLILTASREQALLPTICSRLQTLAIKKPTKAQLDEHFGGLGYASAEIAQAYAVSGGLPGLMSSLLANSEHPLRPATDLARKLLQSSTYERLLLVDELTKQKGLALDVTFILQQMAHARLLVTDGSQFTRWQKILQVSYRASEDLQSSAQSKLVLDHLMLGLA